MLRPLSDDKYCLSSKYVSVFVYQSVLRSTWFDVCLSVCLFVCLSVCVSVCLFVCLFVCQPVCLSVCLSVCFSVYLLVCLPVCLSVSLSVCHVVRFYHSMPDCLILNAWIRCFKSRWLLHECGFISKSFPCSFLLFTAETSTWDIMISTVHHQAWVSFPHFPSLIPYHR